MPSPSPTITRAVKLKRRPPFTTLATRLIATTRSMKAVLSAPWPPRRSSRLPRPDPPPAPVRRWDPLMSNYLFSFLRRSSCRLRSQREATLAGTVGQGGDPSVVLVARAVEHDALDAGRLRPLGDKLADPACLGRLVSVERAQLGLHRARRGERLADEVVDDLDAHVPRRAGDHHARPLRRTGDLLATPDLTAQTRGDPRARVLAGLECDSHRHLPAFPTLRRICSPAYRTPLPL